ncbi:MAG: MFS transporter [Bacteroidaceae bacterium]|nr:MFS transporter [Bacteroidaceae bacterium]
MKKTNFRWTICAMLFMATLVNYMDRQVLSLTYTDFIAKDFHWDDTDYGTITGVFSVFYAFISLFAGKFIDIMGTKKGYIWAIVLWSLAACMHAGCGWLTMVCNGAESMEALRGMEKASQIGLMGITFSVWCFIACRCFLAAGEAGNFPAAIKVTAEYFPKKDRAFATSIFNAGASVGALLAPITIPQLAKAFGWEMAFIIIGGIGFIWAGLWIVLYKHPHESKFVNKAELEYINQDSTTTPAANEENAKAEESGSENVTASEEGKKSTSFSIIDCFKYRQTWAFIMGKFLTDGVWWFFLFWAPAYFKELGCPASSGMGQLLLFVLYLIVTFVSIVGGYLPKYFVEKRGMHPYAGRMRAMLLFAFLPIFGLIAQPLAGVSVWWPAIIIGLAGAGHQAWSANLYSTIGDMFPKRAIATITGIGTMFGGLCSFGINYGAGKFFTYAEENGFSFFGAEGKAGAYMLVFCYCAIAYVLAWFIIKALVPKFRPID